MIPAGAGYFLVVRFWVAPQAERQMLAWLEGGHNAEVVGQPGFLWCRRIRLEKDAQGWQGWSMIYGIRSEADFLAYNGNQALMARFAAERAPFAQHLKIDRFAGPVDHALDAPSG